MCEQCDKGEGAKGYIPQEGTKEIFDNKIDEFEGPVGVTKIPPMIMVNGPAGPQQ